MSVIQHKKTKPKAVDISDSQLAFTYGGLLKRRVELHGTLEQLEREYSIYSWALQRVNKDVMRAHKKMLQQVLDAKTRLM
jgi:hypothetical protein